MDLEDPIRRHIETNKAMLHALLLTWAGTLEGHAKSNAPWKDRLGHARQGIHAGVDDFGDRQVLYLAHGMAYGIYLEKGTGIYGPHGQPIKPVTKKALFGPGLPHPVKQVKGMEAKPIIKPTIDDHIDRIKKSVEDLWRS